MCRLIKLMPDVQVPLKDVNSAFEKVLNQTEEQIAKLGIQKYSRLLEYAVTLAENQFGKRIAGISLHARKNGGRIDAWNVEIDTLYKIHSKLGYHNLSPNDIPYYKKALEILDPWILQIDLSELEQIDVLSKEQIHHLFQILSETESTLRVGYRKIYDLDDAKHYQEQAIIHLKRLKEGEDKIKRVFDNLSSLANLFTIMGKFI